MGKMERAPPHRVCAYARRWAHMLRPPEAHPEAHSADCGKIVRRRGHARSSANLVRIWARERTAGSAGSRQITSRNALDGIWREPPRREEFTSSSASFVRIWPRERM